MFSLQYKNVRITIYFLMLLYFLITSIVRSQSSDKYILEKYTYSVSGGYSQSGRYEMVNVTGQLSIPGGAAQSEKYILEVGFLPGRNMLTKVERIKEQMIPAEFALNQNYPNPFNPATTIKYSVKQECTVTLKLYDILGREIGTIVDETLPPGIYGVNFDASNLPTGVYFYCIRMKDFVAMRKLVLLR